MLTSSRHVPLHTSAQREHWHGRRDTRDTPADPRPDERERAPPSRAQARPPVQAHDPYAVPISRSSPARRPLVSCLTKRSLFHASHLLLLSFRTATLAVRPWTERPSHPCVPRAPTRSRMCCIERIYRRRNAIATKCGPSPEAAGHRWAPETNLSPLSRQADPTDGALSQDFGIGRSCCDSPMHAPVHATEPFQTEPRF